MTAANTMSAEAGVVDERAGLADPFIPIVRAARTGDAAAFEELMLLSMDFTA